MRPADEDKLRELAETTVADAGVGLDLEEVIVVAAGRRTLVRVVVDGDNGVSLDAAAEVSRALAAALDLLDAAGDSMLGADPYTLEVTSPGIGRPLTAERHFRRARGRLVTLKMLDGSSVEGRVRRVVGDTVELLTTNTDTTAAIPLAEIRRGKVEVEFAKLPAAHEAVLAADGFVDPARAFDDVDAELDDEPEGVGDDELGELDDERELEDLELDELADEDPDDVPDLEYDTSTLR